MSNCLINDRKTLNEFINYEKELYFPNMTTRQIRRMKRLHWERYQIWQCMFYLRKAEYYYSKFIENKNNGVVRRLYSIIFDCYTRKKNIACGKVGLELNYNSLGKGTDIWHNGVIINGTVGDDCCFHGANTLGLKSNQRSGEKPILGDRVDVGVGAIIVGNVEIADDCIIGAGAVVIKSCLIPGTILVGVPAKPLE